jgi:tetratricopeptide (TPR) repeat protein
MRYDSLGFPIPTEFDRIDDGRDAPTLPTRDRGRRPTAGPLKRLFVGLALLGVVGTAVVGPAVLPTVREVVVRWSLERAIASEGQGDYGAAVADLSRAIDWAGSVDDVPLAKSRLLCWRAMLRIKNRDASGGLDDASMAVSYEPTGMQPWQVRALALFVLGNTDGSLEAAQTAVDLVGDDDAEALNHRAYMRALAGRDLEAALDDIERALATSGPSPEFLDTRGYILHLLGRHHQAIDDLNVAIDTAQNDRRRLLTLAGHVDPQELAYRLLHADHSLAVMHHHRGLACRAAGLTGQADQDFAVAERKGFDPSRGIL